MCDVLFVVPSRAPDIKECFYGTMLLTTILRNNGINADIYNFYEADKSKGFDRFVDETVENILGRNPKILSFYCRCDCFLADVMIAKSIKEKSPETFIVFGGPQADTTSYKTLEELPWIDFCCRGEGETTVYPLFSALLNGTDYSSVEGLSYRDSNNNIIENPTASLIEDLDSIPFVDYDLLPEEALNNCFAVPFNVGRGCPFNCAYCSSSLFWKRKFRLHSTDRIISEMNMLNEKYGFTKFRFEHDLFTANKKRILDFCEKLNATGKGYTWDCSSRIDTIDEETIEVMAKSGLKAIYLGIETGSPRMQKLICKNLKIDDVIDTVEILVKNKIIITASFMYGFPEETEEDLEATLQLALKLHRMGVKTLQFHLCAITPGTPYYYQYKDNLTFSVSHSNISGDFGIAEHKDFVENHKDIFSFFFEYKSDLRDKYGELSPNAKDSLIVYDILSKLIPDEMKNIRILDVAESFIRTEAKENAKVNLYKKALNYIKENFSGKEAEKLGEIFRYLNVKYEAAVDTNFINSIESFSFCINDFNKGEPLSAIAEGTSLVYLTKIQNKLNIKISYKS